MCLAKNREMAKLLSAEMSAHTLTKEYTGLLCNFSPFFPFPQQGVIRQSLTDPNDKWSVQDTSSETGPKERRFICSPQFELADTDSLTMVTFYEIIRSLSFDGTNWIDFVNNAESERERESYHLVRFQLETGKKHQIRLASSKALSSPIVGDFSHDYDS